MGGDYTLSGTHSWLLSFRAGSDVWNERSVWREASPRLSALSRRNILALGIP